MSPYTRDSSDREIDEETPMRKRINKVTGQKSPKKVVTRPGYLFQIPFDDIGEHIVAQHSSNKESKSNKTSESAKAQNVTYGQSILKTSSKMTEKNKSKSENEENQVVVDRPVYSFANVYKNLAPASVACVPCTAPGTTFLIFFIYYSSEPKCSLVNLGVVNRWVEDVFWGVLVPKTTS